MGKGAVAEEVVITIKQFRIFYMMNRILNGVLVVSFLLASGAEFSLHPWGRPRVKVAGLKVLRYRAFECGYLPKLKLSLWVAYRYFRTREVARSRYRGRFMPDTFRLERSEAAFPQVYDSVPEFIRYKIDRGHLAPDAAIKAFGNEAQRETYFLTNIIPQFANTNRFIWAALEGSIRKWAGADDTVWVLVGPVFYPGRDTVWLGTHNVAIPHASYCVVLRRHRTAVISFVVPNDSLRRTASELSRFLVSVDSVERLTGLDLFPLLADSVEQRLEAQLPGEGMQPVR